jgi:uncharacterized protein (TIGR03084 family)
VKTDQAGIVADLAAERAVLDAMVGELTPAQWSTRTPAEGWDVCDSVSHLHYFDGTALLALHDPEAFAVHAAQLLDQQLGAGYDTAAGRELGGEGLLSVWRATRVELMAALATTDPATRVPWYGPPMSLISFVTARLMETWAHGHDVADALGIPVVPTDRLRHVCHIGVGARAYSFLIKGKENPTAPVRVELTGPSGDTWSWGPEDAADRVTGTALDFAQVVTHRRHRDDTRLAVAGPVAQEWMAIAQAFAGPSGSGRQPLTPP